MKPLPWSVWELLRVDLLIADYKRVEGGRSLREFAGHTIAWFVEEGEVEVETPSTKLTARAGEWLLPLSGSYAREISEQNRLLTVRIAMEWPTGESLFQDVPPVILADAKIPELRREAMRVLDLVRRDLPEGGVRVNWQAARMLRRDLTAAHFLELTAAAHAFALAMVRALEVAGHPPHVPRVRDDRLVEALHILDRVPLREPLTEAGLAGRVGLSVSQLKRLFADELGQSAATLLRRRRAAYAESLLRETDLPIKEIAYEAGFPSLSAFSDWCLREFGMRPRDLRTSGHNPEPSI